jgi:alkaline phosphatase
MDEAIAADYLKTDIDLFVGGGRKFFEKRADSVNLLTQLAKNNYQLPTSLEGFEKIKSGKVAALVVDEHLPKMSEGRGDFEPRAVAKAMSLLNQNKKGFFLMIEGSQIDWGGHANDADYITQEMQDFDKTIGVVLDWAKADGNTLVVITADHETGGFSIPEGNIKNGTITGKFTTKDHTGVMVPVFAFGPGAEAFMGIYENNSIFSKFMNAYGFNKPTVGVK